MGEKIAVRIREMITARKLHQRWIGAFLLLAVACTAVTVTLLTRPSEAKTDPVPELRCVYAVHRHSEDCYDENGQLVCGLADNVLHTHDETCFLEGELICPLEEITGEPHLHSEDCYAEDGALICGKLQIDEHTHGPDCFVTPGVNGELQTAQPTLPAACFEERIGSTWVTVDAPEGALPEGSKLALSPWDGVDAELTAALSGKPVWRQAMAITFIGPSGEAVLPELPLTVTFTDPALAEPGPTRKVRVLRLEEAGAQPVEADAETAVGQLTFSGTGGVYAAVVEWDKTVFTEAGRQLLDRLDGGTFALIRERDGAYTALGATALGLPTAGERTLTPGMAAHQEPLPRETATAWLLERLRENAFTLSTEVDGSRRCLRLEQGGDRPALALGEAPQAWAIVPSEDGKSFLLEQGGVAVCLGAEGLVSREEADWLAVYTLAAEAPDSQEAPPEAEPSQPDPLPEEAPVPEETLALRIVKEVQGEGETAPTEGFSFRAYVEEDGALVPYANGEYTLLDSQGVETSLRSSPGGAIPDVKAGDTVVIAGLAEGTDFLVFEEETPENCKLTSITATVGGAEVNVSEVMTGSRAALAYAAGTVTAPAAGSIGGEVLAVSRVYAPQAVSTEGYQLPSTGGGGSHKFTLGGLALALAACGGIIFISKRRKTS